MAEEELKKAKTTRARHAGWVTRAIKQYESSKDSITVLQLIKDRISSQLTKLQDSNDTYTSLLTEEAELKEADEWMDDYFQKATEVLAEIDMKLDKTTKVAKVEGQPSSIDASIEELSKEIEAASPSDNTNSSESTNPGANAAERPTSSTVDISDSTANTDDTSSNSPSNEIQVQPPTFTPIDAWIDDLVVGRETSQSSPAANSDIHQMIARLEIDRDLPKVELPVFDGSPLAWPRFVEQFFVQVHSRPGLNDSRRMDLLQSHVKGDAKQIIHGLGYSGKNYAQSLKELKFAFGHRAMVARAYVDAIASGNVLPSHDATALRTFYIAVRDCIVVLHQMNYVGELSSSDVLQRTMTRIPYDKRGKWNDYVRNICRLREPTLKDLEKWLKDCIEAEFNPYAVSTRQPRQQQSSVSSGTVRHVSSNTAQASNDKTCPLCSAHHQLSSCPEYMCKSQEGRYELVKTLRLCFNCLNDNHMIAECRSSVHCKVAGCNRKHHTSLHRHRQQVVTPASEQPAEGQVNNIQSKPLQIYFQVLPVTVQGNNGRKVSTFALLDSGSDITMISSDLADDIGLGGQHETLKINTVNSSSFISSKRVSLSVRPLHEPDAPSIWIKEAWTKLGVFKCPPVKTADLKGLAHLCDIGIVDVPSDEVKLLIGANVPRAHIQIDCRDGHFDGPVAIRTLLGWCIMGPSTDNLRDNVEANVNFIVEQNDELSFQVEKFWKTESFGVSAAFKKPTSIEDLRATEVLDQHTRFENGRFEVPMLWRDVNCKLPDNRSVAERRFELLRKRLSKDSNLQESYQAVIDGYIANGYARKLTIEEEVSANDKTWYLPHHCVLNPNKPGKVRVVFDAAATYNGVSLNSHLMSGPDLANNLFAVLQRFRMKPVALVADIKEMFHQFRVPDLHSDALRFLWKEDLQQAGPPQVYKMLVHIFGAKDSPCCVNFALRRAAKHVDENINETILSNFYVDDMLKAVEDVPTAITVAHNTSSILASHGFQLTKWMSSSREVLASMPQSTRAIPELDLDLDQLPLQRALGLSWNVQEDCFTFRPVVKTVNLTKRTLISIISSIFDPCGFLTPFTFRAKCIIQDVWRAGLDWDDLIPGDIQERWKIWYDELEQLSSLRIPRFHGCTSATTLELHVFSDASESAFAAAAYLRMFAGDVISVSFLASKSHIAPVKQVLTIPKLELQGAVMAIRLSNSLAEDLDVSRTVFWTDAFTVLRYVNNEHRRWKIFVANRVAEIRESSEPNQWRYVPTTLNPADDATRGLSAQMIVSPNRWINGPSFLWQSEDHWPIQPEITPPKDSDDDIRRSVGTVMMTAAVQDGEKTFNISDVIDTQRFSSWLNLQRHTAWVLRAAKNFCALLSRNLPVTHTYLSVPELHDAEMSLVRLAQQEGFPAEYKSLQQNNELDERSSIFSLTPFLDVSLDMIRVGGRLHHASIVDEAKHQFLLPYDHHITRLLARDAHMRLMHGGPEHMIASLRQRFWPVKCRQMVKKIQHDCMDCRRKSVQPAVPLMANLPKQRISGFTRPFQFTGLDYFGPMTAKRARSRVKKWGCIFTCLVTRAIHLELADSLLTDDFIMALRCFICRRGQPAEIFSDNGTNFKGAERELQENLHQLDQERIHKFLQRSHTTWHFIPPYSPHFGGVWESLVKSVKRALQAVLKEQIVTESVLRTTLIEVEAVVNSRPLTYNSSDPTDFTALTPNHFLHGGATIITPPGSFETQEICSRKRWRQSQVIADHVWRRWLQQYLPTLTVRSHWQAEVRNLQVNDLVVLAEDNIPRGQWNLGRILEVYPSVDGRVRSVKIKTARGEYCRPAAKIALLEEGHVES